MPKKISISLLGLVLNGVFNGLFIIQIAAISDSDLLTLSMLMWSGFFVAGASIAPFENYLLYGKILSSKQQSYGKIVVLSCVTFTFVGLSVLLFQGTSLWIIPVSMLVGLCISQITYLRSEAIFQQQLIRIALSNSLEGIVRAGIVYLCFSQFERPTLIQVLISYLTGNVASLFPYIRLKKQENNLKAESMPASKVYGLAIVGLLTALTTGGIPFLAGYFEVGISSLLFFFTLSRSLLVFQSVFVYVKPKKARDLGAEKISLGLLRFLLLVTLLCFFVLYFIKYLVDMIFRAELSEIYTFDLVIYSVALVTSGYFNLKIAAQNSTTQWRSALFAGLFGFFAACLAFIEFDSGKSSFYAAIIFAPLFGILTLIQQDKSRDKSK